MSGKGRVENGRANLGSFEIPYPQYEASSPAPATAYVRNHELDVDKVPHGENSIAARVVHINRSGASVKLALITSDESQRDVSAELDHQRVAELQIRNGETVYLFPRHVRIFVNDKNINEKAGADNRVLESAVS